MNLTDLQSASQRKTKKRIGRGGDRGKTSGRGHKGQKQHGSHGIRPAIRDFIKKLPKLRGHGINRARTVVYKPAMVIVNLGDIEEVYKAGETVSVDTLAEKGLISSSRQAIKKGIKVLGNGNLSKKLTFQISNLSASAKEKIEKAGGTIS